MMYQEGPMFAGFEGVPELDVDGVARAGEPLAMGKAAASEAALIEAVSTVYDPEIPINIYDLGLIYEVEGGPDGSVKVAMTLTAPGCPSAGALAIVRCRRLVPQPVERFQSGYLAVIR